MNFKETVQMTAEWYDYYLKDKNVKNILPTDAFKLFEAKPNEKYISFDKKFFVIV